MQVMIDRAMSSLDPLDLVGKVLTTRDLRMTLTKILLVTSSTQVFLQLGLRRMERAPPTSAREDPQAVEKAFLLEEKVLPAAAPMTCFAKIATT